MKNTISENTSIKQLLEEMHEDKYKTFHTTESNKKFAIKVENV